MTHEAFAEMTANTWLAFACVLEWALIHLAVGSMMAP